MHKYECCNPPKRPPNRPPQFTNAFIDLNGVPYLLGEYLDRTSFQMIDRSLIRTELFVDPSEEAMRRVIDINIDDVGKRPDGSMQIIGNNTKHNNLIGMIQRHSKRLMQRLDIIQSGIVVRINFQLENQRTKQIIRTTTEDIRIHNRKYFIDINQRNIDDNGLITNFTHSIVSTINQFTHGTDRMLLRITSVQLFYEGLRRDGAMRIAQPIVPHQFDPDSFIPDIDFDPYKHHQIHNSRQFITNHIPGGFCECGAEFEEPIIPPSWTLFNRFYHFDNMTRDINLHTAEIYESRNQRVMIPCGIVHFGRSFMINPGSRIVFKISIWKNDITAVADTSRIAKALGVQFFGDFRPDHSNHHGDSNLSHLVRQQGKAIKHLLKELSELKGADCPTCAELGLEEELFCEVCGQKDCICVYDTCGMRECTCQTEIACDQCGELVCVCEPITPPDPNSCGCPTYEGMSGEMIREILNGNWIK